MAIDLTVEIKDIKGNPIEVAELKPMAEGKPLSADSKKRLDEFLVNVSDAEKEELLLFAKDYIRKTELAVKNICLRDVLQTIAGGIKDPTPKDKIRMAKLLPKIDDNEIQVVFSEVEREWLVEKLMKIPNAEIGSVIQARVLSILDPEGEISIKYGTDKEQTV